MIRYVEGMNKAVYDISWIEHCIVESYLVPIGDFILQTDMANTLKRTVTNNFVKIHQLGYAPGLFHARNLFFSEPNVPDVGHKQKRRKLTTADVSTQTDLAEARPVVHTDAATQTDEKEEKESEHTETLFDMPDERSLSVVSVAGSNSSNKDDPVALTLSDIEAIEYQPLMVDGTKNEHFDEVDWVEENPVVELGSDGDRAGLMETGDIALLDDLSDIEDALLLEFTPGQNGCIVIDLRAE